MKIQIIKTFEIDPLIADSIIILNKKGYSTSFSCSGHSEKFFSTTDKLVTKVKGVDKVYYCGTYVCFMNNYFDDIPINWIRGLSTTNINSIYRFFTEEEYNKFTKDELISIAMHELKSWVNKLNDNEQSLIYDTIEINTVE